MFWVIKHIGIQEYVKWFHSPRNIKWTPVIKDAQRFKDYNLTVRVSATINREFKYPTVRPFSVYDAEDSIPDTDKEKEEAYDRAMKGIT